MKNVQVVYIYDALCGWCFGFSNVIKQLSEEYADDLDFDILSGGMIIGDREGLLDPQFGKYILEIIPRLEDHAGVKFGEPYKQQIADGSLYQSSLKPSIALAVFKTFDHQHAIAFASAMQQLQFVEGKNLEADETYIELAKRFGVDEAEFMQKLHSDESRSAALDEFKFIQQLGVTGFPAVIAIHRQEFYSVSKGFQSYEKLKPVFEQLKTLD
jgi:putative protein-disulfide isomerase